MSATSNENRQTVTSEDGTAIAYWPSGNGPALVLVHGTAADHTRWRPVLDIFGEHFSVCAIDRRGRGGSGDSVEYAMEREFEDLAAVVDSLEEPVYLLGHSYGGVCALGASLLTSKLDRLVLYEPPVKSSGTVPPDLIDRLARLIADDRREEALIAFNTEVLHMSSAQIEAFRALPAWPARIAAAHTVPRELRSIDRYEFNPGNFTYSKTPTLILGGGDSPAFLQTSNAMVHDALRNSNLVVMPGQQHAAIDTGTDVFAKHVIDFLLS